jgi:hypothetical protein
MKYLKKFESFTINENESAEVAAEEVVRKKIDSMSDEDKEKVKSELMKMADKLGLSAEEMTDPHKVGAALASKQGQIKLESSSVNEGFSDWWGRVKKTFYSWMTKLGIVGVIGSIVTAAIGAGFQEKATNLADYVPDSVVYPNAAVVIGGIAFVISFTAMLIGLNNIEIDNGNSMSDERSRKIIANRKAKYGR